MEFWGSDHFYQFHWLLKDIILHFNEEKEECVLLWLYVLCGGR